MKESIQIYMYICCFNIFLIVKLGSVKIPNLWHECVSIHILFTSFIRRALAFCYGVKPRKLKPWPHKTAEHEGMAAPIRKWKLPVLALVPMRLLIQLLLTPCLGNASNVFAINNSKASKALVASKGPWWGLCQSHPVLATVQKKCQAKKGSRRTALSCWLGGKNNHPLRSRLHLG